MRRRLRLAGYFIMMYALYCGFLFVFQKEIVYPRSAFPPGTGELPPIQGIERVWLDVSGRRTEIWLIPAGPPFGEKAAGVILFAHGNGETIDEWAWKLAPFRQLGLSILLVEYPGYGRSGGQPSEASITETMVAAYDWTTETGLADKSKVVVMGRSLGGAAACRLADRREVGAVMLLSAFTSARELARRYLVPTWLLLDPFENLEIVSRLSVPVGIFHGRADTVVPYGHGLRLHQAAPGSLFFTYPCGHNDFPGDWNGFRSDAASFLSGAGILARQGKIF